MAGDLNVKNNREEALNRIDRYIPHIPVKVCAGEKTYSLSVKEKESILDALMAQDASFTAVCGSTGRCGKCKIRVTEGFLPVTPSDQAYFTKEELDCGMRLSCKAYPPEPVQAELHFQGEAGFQAVTSYRQQEQKTSGKNTSAAAETESFGIAADIGTTTIAIQLISLKTRKPLATYTGMNHQRNYGADVISRITAASEGKAEAMRKSVQRDLAKGIRAVVKESGILPEKVTELVVAGNTTMIHLLMGYPCKGLGEYPFTPVNIGLIEDTCENILDDPFLSARIRILPGISTFVGGDIVAGLYACSVDRSKEYSLLIDLGTNGEIALGNRDKIIVSSTAAGPAFEGGNITWGIGSIDGAISNVSITAQGPVIRTIHEKTPTGICGTGVIETVFELLEKGLVDETGCLNEAYFEYGYPLAKNSEDADIVLTQKDIREIQLAKSAVRAGIETLLLRYGIQKEAVSHVYLAGGFGYKLDCRKAIGIGMIPGGFADKIETIGNSSLGGSVKCLLEEDGVQRMSAIISSATEVHLSADKDFNDFYIENMLF